MGPFQGQDRFVARKNVVQQLEADGVLVKVEDKHTVPYKAIAVKSLSNLCQPSGLSKFLADRALEFLDTIHQSLYPSAGLFIATGWRNKRLVYSRQLWWGHQTLVCSE